MSEGKVLDLAEVFHRHTVKMRDGKVYELRNPQELSILQDYELRTLLVKIEEFVESGVDTEDDAKKASKMLQDLATLLVVGLDTEIEDRACVAIFEFWMENAPAAPDPDPPMPRAVRRRTTAASSRGSKPSTAASRKNGSTSRRGR